MSSGYGKQVLKEELCNIGDGDNPDGFDPSACQTYRDVDQFLIAHRSACWIDGTA